MPVTGLQLVFILPVRYSNIILTTPVSDPADLGGTRATSLNPATALLECGRRSKGFSGEVIDGREENVSAA